MPKLHPQLANLLNFEDQAVVITGASRGLGRAMAQVFHRAGANVAMLARTQADLDTAAGDLRAGHPDGGEVLALAVDVAVEAQVNAAIQQILDAWGRIDVLVNNAGLVSPGSVDRIDTQEWQRVLDANLSGAYYCVRAVVPAMQTRRHGRIINISSISAQTGGVSGGVHYAASKGGMLAMTKTLARDLAQYSITVNSITPGQIDSRPNMLDAAARERIIGMIPLGKLGEPNDIAYAALYLASPMGSYVTGATLDVNGGILKR